MGYGELSNTQETMVMPLLQMKNIRGKPYITVSAKGMINGLSNIPNDGADFGPDTTKGATAPGQYGSPYTETLGLQDAFNYLLANNGGKIFVTNGYYELGENIIGITATSSPSGYIVPGTYSPTNQITIDIEGESAITNTPNAVAISDITVAGVVIHSTNLKGQYTAVLSFYSANVALRIKNIIISQPQYTSGYGMKMAFELSTTNSNSIVLKNCFAMVDENADAGVGTPNYAAGFDTGRYYEGGYPVIFENCNTFGYPVGFLAASHTSFIGSGAIYCSTAVVFYESDHPIIFNNFDIADCSIYLYVSSTVSAPVYIYGTINIEWQTASSNYNITNFVYDPDNYLTGEIQLQSHQAGDTSTFTPLALSTMNNNGGLYLRIMQKPNNPAPTTPSVPASGTAQQNTNPYPVDVYVYGGDVTEIQITKGGTAYTVFSVSTAIAMSGQAYKLNPSDSITVTYTTAPTWEWLSD